MCPCSKNSLKYTTFDLSKPSATIFFKCGKIYVCGRHNTNIISIRYEIGGQKSSKKSPKWDKNGQKSAWCQIQSHQAAKSKSFGFQFPKPSQAANLIGKTKAKPSQAANVPSRKAIKAATLKPKVHPKAANFRATNKIRLFLAISIFFSLFVDNNQPILT